MSEIRYNRYIERDQITLALKRRAARLLAEHGGGGGMGTYNRKQYVHTVRALRVHLVETERQPGGGITDPYRPIYDLWLQERGEWYGEGNPGPTRRATTK